LDGIRGIVLLINFREQSRMDIPETQHWIHKTQDEKKTKHKNRKLKRRATWNQPNPKVLEKGEQFLPLI